MGIESDSRTRADPSSAHLLRLLPQCLADVSSIAAKERPAVPKSPSDAYVDGVKFLTPEAPPYATAREVHNAGILMQPKVIACCTSKTGVQHALERAKAENWPVAVKAKPYPPSTKRATAR